MSERHSTRENPQQPERYAIRITGHLDTRWAAQFEPMSIIHARDGTTILTGPVVDQAALHGMLRKVRDLGLPLVSVMPIDASATNESDGNTDAD